MTQKKEQTPIDWFLEQIGSDESPYRDGYIDMLSSGWQDFEKLANKAKEMHKQQMKMAYLMGGWHAIDIRVSISPYALFESYYNDLYNEEPENNE